MTTGKDRPGASAIARRGWLLAHKWLLLRRAAQVLFLAVFLSGPLAGVWISKGNLSSSLTFGVLPLTDPYLMVQSLAAAHALGTTAVLGALIVALTYALIGGRMYCSWMCPINPVTDAARVVRRRLGLGKGWQPTRTARLWLLAMTLIVSAVTGTIAWEVVNPVSMAHRGLIFGVGFAWAIVLAVFLFDSFVGRDGWCGHLCPVGAFYGLLGSRSLGRIKAARRRDCDDCMDCFAVCPEPHVITPALKGESRGASPMILSRDCTNCGRCIDVCSKDVFRIAWRFDDAPEGAEAEAAAMAERQRKAA
jgi:ferredoxin-type protein NapH